MVGGSTLSSIGIWGWDGSRESRVCRAIRSHGRKAQARNRERISDLCGGVILINVIVLIAYPVLFSYHDVPVCVQNVYDRVNGLSSLSGFFV